MVFCCFKKKSDINKEIISVDVNKILLCNIYYYKLLIINLKESLNYIYNSNQNDLNNNIFEYYLCIYSGCYILITCNMYMFMHFFNQENYINQILEIMLSINFFFKDYMFVRQLSGNNIIQIKGDKLFYRANIFWFQKNEPTIHYTVEDFNINNIKKKIEILLKYI